MQLERFGRASLLLALCLFAGCRVLSPVAIEPKSQYIAPALLDASDPQVEIGRPNKVIDTVGNVIGIPTKLLFWNRRLEQHKISEETLLTATDYLENNGLPHVKLRANQYAPLEDWGRLRKNTTVSPWIRYTVGTLSVAQEAVFPGRVFGGDHFNPYTQTIHLYSDLPTVALHECAHAKDFTRREYQGLYSLAYGILPIWHETIATEDVYAYLETADDQRLLVEADRVLYPAYGSYIGNALGNVVPAYSFPIYLGTIALGHANGRAIARERIAAHPEIFGAD
ncbi:hypothetical protein Pla52n_43050 [Stieleria varia]|uniref:Lipoprotein n=2 Tax=Stieleria varia TaxID=2528005 RepID=A0A5C6ALN2_9BACT|nr:hypothetical protein Pla52n_43050 [Stieleria varia]